MDDRVVMKRTIRPFSLHFVPNKTSARKLALLRAGVIISLISVIALVGSLSFILLRFKETSNFDTVFKSSVDQISKSVKSNLKSKLLAASLVDDIYSYSVVDNQVGVIPNVTISGYQNIVGKICEMVSARNIAFDPILTKSSRKSWEAYASAHVDLLEGPDSLEVSSNGSWIVSNGIYTVNSNHLNVYSPSYKPGTGHPDHVIPIWQIAPISQAADVVMYDVYSQNGSVEVIDRVLSTKSPGFTDFIQLVEDYHLRPSTVLFSPIRSLANNDIIGLSDMAFSWDVMLMNSLPSYISGLICIISTSSKTFSYLLSNGKVGFLGEGDLHDSSFDQFKETIATSVSTASSEYIITIYPSRELYSKYITNTPIIVCSSFVALVVFTSLVFIAYDYFLTDRDSKLEHDITSSTMLTRATLDELEVKKQFVRYISHEIRTPLNTVQMGLEVLRQEIQQGSSQHQLDVTVQDIRDSCGAALEVVNDFLLFDKITSNKLELELSPCNLQNFIRDTLKPFHMQARHKLISLEIIDRTVQTQGLDDDSELGLHGNRLVNVSIDRYKMAQVIRNLISNTLKFTPREGRIDVIVGESSSPSSGEPRFLIEVIDSGAGISREDQQRLFREVVQFHPGKLQGGGGSGLGMFISHGIAVQHGGDLRVFSKGEGNGTTFTLEIPVYKKAKQASVSDSIDDGERENYIPGLKAEVSTYDVDAKPERPPMTSVQSRNISNVIDASLELEELSRHSQSVTEQTTRLDHSPPHRSSHSENRSIRVLIVDDTASNRKMLSRMLSNSIRNCVCDQAEDGLEAIRLVRRDIAACIDVTTFSGREYDVIILDYSMPGMDGPDVAMEIRSIGFKGLIIGATGYVDQREHDLFRSMGADFVLVKPLNLARLLEVIESASPDCRNLTFEID